MAGGQGSLTEVLQAWAYRTGKIPVQPWGEKTIGGLLLEFYLDLALELKTLKELESTEEIRNRIVELEKLFYGSSNEQADAEWIDEMIAQLERDLGESGDVEICPSRKKSG